MGKDNDHVLDWGEIAKDDHKWQTEEDRRQAGADAAKKGLDFEDVVERLLQAMFPEEKWRRTCQTHDGKRDFVFPAEEFLPELKRRSEAFSQTQILKRSSKGLGKRSCALSKHCGI